MIVPGGGGGSGGGIEGGWGEGGGLGAVAGCAGEGGGGEGEGGVGEGGGGGGAGGGGKGGGEGGGGPAGGGGEGGGGCEGGCEGSGEVNGGLGGCGGDGGGSGGGRNGGEGGGEGAGTTVWVTLAAWTIAVTLKPAIVVPVNSAPTEIVLCSVSTNLAGTTPGGKAIVTWAVWGPTPGAVEPHSCNRRREPETSPGVRCLNKENPRRGEDRARERRLRRRRVGAICSVSTTVTSASVSRMHAV